MFLTTIYDVRVDTVRRCFWPSLDSDGWRAQLEPYLDVPAFARGDLFFLQKLVAAINAYER